MPSYAYYIEPTEDEEIEIDKKMIDGCDDHETLRRWMDGLEDRHEILSMQNKAFHLSPRDDANSLRWLRRVHMALAATGIGIGRLRRRMIAVGAITPDPRDVKIAALEHKITNLRAELEEAKARK